MTCAREICLRPRRRLRFLAALAVCLGAGRGIAPLAALSAPSPNPPAVFNLSIARAEKAAALLRTLYPRATFKVDRDANALIVIASPEDLAGLRSVIAGIDVKNPTATIVDNAQFHNVKPEEFIRRLGSLFPKARFAAAPNNTIVIASSAADMAEIKAVVNAIDTPLAPPTPKPVYPTQIVHVLQTDPRAVARAIARSIPNLHIAVSGTDILISGPPDQANDAKAAAALLDHPGATTTVTKVYRFHFVDASSVAALFARSFPNVGIQVDKDLNAITVVAIPSVQERAADAADQLDASPNASTSPGSSGGGAQDTEVVALKAAVPATNTTMNGGTTSTSAADIAQSVSQALAATAPDLKIIVHPNSTRLILTGSFQSVQLAKDLIAKLDVAEPLVELDTEVYEVDDGVQKQLGLKFPAAALTSTFSESTPAPSTGGQTPTMLRFQAITRTPLSLQSELDFLVSTNRAQILENPRITTFSGRTASLRAGETVNVLTTTGGGTGTVATTQIQSFQTGVTLDITPVVNTDDYVTLTLHPSVNSEAGISAAGVPNIQTRDTTTTVGLHDGETIVVGGLIEDTNTRTVTKIPILGDIPLIGRLFQDIGTTRTRNELIVTVTPHILKSALPTTVDASPRLTPPPEAALPAIVADATLPPRRRRDTAAIAPVTPIAPVAVPTPARYATAPPPGSITPMPLTPPPAAPASANSAFAQTNVFTYGSPPPNNYADPAQAPQIFYVQVKPTVVKNGQPVTISAVTTSNVTSVTFGSSSSAIRESLGSIGAGKWQGTFPLNTSFLPAQGGNITMNVTATTSAAASTSINIPLSLVISSS
jgi:type II secretory pathway component GspD/PulD (secretin)